MVLLILLIGCAPTGPSVRSAEELGVVSQPAITGRDGGGSARVFGSSVWTSGDTVLAMVDEQGTSWHDNSYAFASGSATTGLTLEDPVDGVGAPRLFMPPSPFEAAFNELHRDEDCAVPPCLSRWALWPGTPVWDAARQQALVPYAVLYLGEDAAEHPGGGHSIAIWDDVEAQPTRPILHPESDFPDILFGHEEGDWATTAAVSDGWFYLFGCHEDGWDRPCRLARAPLDEVQVRTAWRFWDGRDWSVSMDEAVALFDGAPIMSLSWNQHLQAWIVVYTPPLAGEVHARVSPTLTGPWSRASLLYEVPGDAPYDGNEHPELAEAQGSQLIITWSRHTTGWFGSEFVVLRVELE